MDFRKLTYILKIAETGNITKAAEELYMTQPALSHFITKLEKEEGVRLFDRTSVPVRLTYAGERYVETIRRVLELNENLKNEISELQQEAAGRITIGVPPARATDLLPQILPDYILHYPKVEVRTIEHNSRQLREDVRRQQVDFAVLPLLDGFDEFRKIVLFREELLLVTGKGKLSPEAWHTDENGKRIADLSRLASQRFVMLKHGHGIRDRIDFLFEMNGIRPDVLMETTNNETAFSLAAAGLGAAIVPEYNIRRYVPEHPIDVYRITEQGLFWNVGAVVNQNTVLNRYVLGCIQLIKEKYNTYGNNEEK